VGLIIHERLVNLPTELVPPLHEALRRDLEFATTSKEVLASIREAFQFEHFLLISRCFQPAPLGKQKKSKAAKGAAKANSGALFLKFEDELYKQASPLVFSFSGKTSDVSSEIERMSTTRVVMAFPAEKLRTICESLNGLAGETVGLHFDPVPGVAGPRFADFASGAGAGAGSALGSASAPSPRAVKAQKPTNSKKSKSKRGV